MIRRYREVSSRVIIVNCWRLVKSARTYQCINALWLWRRMKQFNVQSLSFFFSFILFDAFSCQNPCLSFSNTDFFCENKYGSPERPCCHAGQSSVKKNIKKFKLIKPDASGQYVGLSGVRKVILICRFPCYDCWWRLIESESDIFSLIFSDWPISVPCKIISYR